MSNKVIQSLIAIFMTAGVFGNLNVIFAIGRRKGLRTKSGMFVLLLSIAHLSCNIHELIGLIFRFGFTPMSKRTCFEYNILYTFAFYFQSSLFLTIALDFCFSIVFPLNHLLWKKTKYVFCMAMFPTSFALFCILLSLYKMTDDVAPWCIFTLTADPLVYKIISTINVTFNVITLIIVVVSVGIALKKTRIMRANRHSIAQRNHSFREEKHKIFRSTFFMIAIYITSWMLATIMFKLLITFTDEKTSVNYLCWIAVIVLPNYCQVYFVAYFRSPRLRHIFREQLHYLTCGLLFPNVTKISSKSMQASYSGGNNNNDNSENAHNQKKCSVAHIENNF